MADQFTNIVGGFEQCEPPFCSYDFAIDITQFECNNNIVYVRWAITDQYNRIWTPSLNVIQYSLNSENFSSSQQVAGDPAGNNNYSVYFDKPGDGLLHIKIKAQINFIFIEGYPENHTPLDMATCVDTESITVPVGFCPQTPFSSVPVYIVKSALPTITDDPNTTFYFGEDSFCWFVDKSLYDSEILVSEVPISAILWSSIPEDNIFSSCEDCADELLGG